MNKILSISDSISQIPNYEHSELKNNVLTCEANSFSKKKRIERTSEGKRTNKNSIRELILEREINESLDLAEVIPERDFQLEGFIQEASLAVETIYRNLNNNFLCQQFIPNAIILPHIIEYKKWILSRKPRKTSVRHKGQNYSAVFPAGSVFRLNNNHLEIAQYEDVFSNPVLDMIAESNCMPSDKVPKYIEHITHQYKVDNQYLYNNSLFHKAFPTIDTYNTSTPESSYYLVLQYSNKKIEKNETKNPFLPKRFDKDILKFIFNNTYQLPNFFKNEIYEFPDKFGITETIGIEFELNSNTNIYLPFSWLQENYTGIRYINFQPNKMPIPPYNGQSVIENPESTILLTHSIYFVDKYKRISRYSRPSRLIPASWICKVKNLDLSYFKNRNIIFLLSKLEGLSIRENINNAIYLMQNIDKSTKIKFIVDDGIQVSCVMNWEELCEYCDTNHKIKLPADPNNQVAMIEKAFLKSENEIEDRPIVIHNFAKLGKIYVIGGGAKTAKSFAASKLGLQISHGDNFLGFKTDNHKVLYFDTEMDDDDYKDRNLPDKQHEGFKIIMNVNLDLPIDINESDDIDKLKYILESIKKYALKYKYKVVFIDCMYRLLNENSPTQVKAFINFLIDLKKEGILTFVVHHFNKSEVDQSDPFKSLSGHSNFYRAVDGGFLFIPDNDSDEPDNDSDEPDKNAPQFMKAVFKARSFPQIPPKDVVFVNGKHMLATEYEEEFGKDEIIQKTQTAVTKLKSFIKENLSDNPVKAVPTDELIKLMCENSEIEWTPETIKRHKLSEWVDKGLLKVTGNKPKKYYQGDKV